MISCGGGGGCQHAAGHNNRHVQTGHIDNPWYTCIHATHTLLSPSNPSNPPYPLLRYWATDYLITALKGEKHLVMISFVITAATGPVAGVFFGGWLIDYAAGGYKGAKQLEKAMRYNVLLAFLATAASIPSGFLEHPYVVVSCIWVLLFFGGACLPPLTGIYIDAVPQRLKALASSISQIAFNMLGYFLSPAISGWIMTSSTRLIPKCAPYPAGRCPEAFTVGFRAVLLTSVVALAFMIFTWVNIKCNYKKLEAEDADEADREERRKDEALLGKKKEGLEEGLLSSDARS